MLIANIPVFTVDFTLNGEKYLVVDSSHFLPEITENAASSTLRLQSFYPWMRSVDIIELHLQSSANARFTLENNVKQVWDEALLEITDEGWTLQFADAAFPAIDKISLWGDEIEVSQITVWSGLNESKYRRAMEVAMRLRGIRLNWFEIANLYAAMQQLSHPAGKPHLIMYDYTQKAMFEHFRTEYAESIGGKLIKTPPYMTQSVLLNRQTPLLFLGEEDNVELHTVNLQKLVRFIQEGRRMFQSGPSARLSEEFIPQAVIMEHYAAIPMEKWGRANPESQKLYVNLLEDAKTLWRLNSAILSPGKRKKYSGMSNAQTGRFLVAWHRLGRLAITGRISPEIASTLIKNYTENEKDNFLWTLRD